MRITGGSHRGRPLAAPAGRGTRPTADKARQALFNILEHGFNDFGLEGLVVADLFAGSGALGLEALSRGAARCIFVENHRPAIAALAENIERLDLAGRAQVLRRDARHLPAATEKAGLVFLDPPYGRGLVGPAVGSLLKGDWLGDDALLVIETAADEIPDLPAGLEEHDHRIYGAARLTFVKQNS